MNGSFKLGVSYSLTISETMDIEKIVSKLNITYPNIKIITAIPNLFTILYIQKYQCEVKLRRDGTIVIYFIYTKVPVDNIEELIRNSINLSSKIIIEFIEKKVITGRVKPILKFIYHGSPDLEKTLICDIIEKIERNFKISVREDIYTYKENIIINLPLKSSITI